MVATSDLTPRLRKGAQMLGALWRSNQRCTFGWDVAGHEDLLILCDCKTETRFCKAKRQWVTLAMTGRKLVVGEYGMAFMMDEVEWDETGLSLRIEVDGKLEVKVGKAGQMKMADFAAISSDPETGRKMLGLLKAFPGSKVQAVAQA